MQRSVNSFIFILVVVAAGIGREKATAQAWQPETSAAAAFPSTLRPQAVPSPPQGPDRVARPADWPGGTTAGEAPNATPWTNPLTVAPPPLRGGPAAATGLVAPARPRQHVGAAAAEAQLDTGSEVVAELELCEGAQPLATVGSDWILAGEILGSINEILKTNEDRIPKDQVEAQRDLLIRQKLRQRIETKLIYQDARRTIPEENYPMVEEKLSEYFEKNELPALIKRAGATSRQDLDAKLQVFGASVDREKRRFMEQALAQQWVQEQVKSNDEISHEQMLAYYQEHIADYEFSAQSRWEQLMVRFASYPDRQAAEAAIVEMGNQVFRGVPFAEVAKARSEGPTASEGGQRDWTSRGSLVSKVLDDTIFGLPVGRLSRILEDEQGLHIVRVVERKDAGRTPFLEAQVGIREKIREQRRREKIEEYLARLKEEIPVWTVFDDPQTANPMAGSLPQQPR
ncbi:MAG: hypothetical protein GXY83_32595 [Rhodopirellula sp.]|nr:hypothetical protein [Rhodopirellula sp.]